MEVDVEPEHLFSLEDCSNLAELTLDMDRSESCVVQDSISILSTLNPARLGHLGRILLKADYVSRWFNEDGQADGEENWEGLDTVLSKLANAFTSKRGKRLTFTLVVVKWDETGKLMPMVRKWLPKLLPRFNELGLLHIHYQRGGLCRTVDDGRLCHDKPDCLKADFQDGC